jgi:hypothetical protein
VVGTARQEGDNEGAHDNIVRGSPGKKEAIVGEDERTQGKKSCRESMQSVAIRHDERLPLGADLARFFMDD